MDMSNLPPGVHERDIPGNRPKDSEWAQIIDDVWGFMQGKLSESKHFDILDTRGLLMELGIVYDEEYDEETAGGTD